MSKATNRYQIPLMKYFFYDRSSDTWTCTINDCGKILDSNERLTHLRYHHSSLYDMYRKGNISSL